jgi:hypothetical protein
VEPAPEGLELDTARHRNTEPAKCDQDSRAGDRQPEDDPNGVERGGRPHERADRQDEQFREAQRIDGVNEPGTTIESAWHPSSSLRQCTVASALQDISRVGLESTV